VICLRYLAVGGTCALVNIAVLVAAEAAGLPLWGSIALSFGLVCAVGYALHATVTFAAPLVWSGFVRYAAAMAAGLPVSAALLWLFSRALDLPMPIAASCATIATLALNFVSSRWAVLRSVRSLSAGNPS
jgi:putative flippase GtrA